MNESIAWKNESEKGSLLGMKLLACVGKVLGRKTLFAALVVVATYYYLGSSKLRNVLATFYHQLGVPHRTRTGILHVARFAQTLADAVMYLSDPEKHSIRFTRNGNTNLDRLNSNKHGAIILSAHVGSIHAMNHGTLLEGRNIVAAMDRSNAKRFTQMMRRLQPEHETVILPIEEGPTFILKARELLDAGNILAFMADRKGPDNILLPFLGAPASFPKGPFMVAALTGVPIYLSFGIFEHPNTYHLSCIPLSERIHLPTREQRKQGASIDEALLPTMKAYVESLESVVRAHPDNWYNFYPFWE